MSVKKDLLKEIDKKAQRIKDRRAGAANKNTPETYIFEFFRNMDDVHKMAATSEDWCYLGTQAYNTLMSNMKSIDPLCLMEVVWYNHCPQGVTIIWSTSYQAANNCSDRVHIDITQMLLS